MIPATWGGDAMPEGVQIGKGGPTVTRSTPTGARKRADRIRRNLEAAVRDLIAAYTERDHEALGYGEGAAGWRAYTEAEFGDLRLLRLPVDDRLELVEAMVEDGFSTREQASGTGVSLGQAHNDRRRLRAVPEPPAEPVVEPPASEPPPAVSKRDRTVQLAAEQGARGLTALELAEVTGWTGGSATGTISDLARQGRLTRTSHYRRAYAAYIVTPPDPTA